MFLSLAYRVTRRVLGSLAVLFRREERRELLDRMLIWNQAHLLHALLEFETHYNLHRPHRSLDQDAPLQPAPEPITSRADIVDLKVRRRDRLGGILHEYENAA